MPSEAAAPVQVEYTPYCLIHHLKTPTNVILHK